MSVENENGVDEGLAIARWHEGHQALHMYLVVINTVVDEATAAVRAGDEDKNSACLSRLAVLYDATTATMQYAADFPQHLYQDTIRPSMSPPLVGQGFSGKLNTEHRMMVVGLKNLAQTLRDTYGNDHQHWPPRTSSLWADVQRAKSENLDRHELICSRFVPEGESLLRQYLAGSARRW